MTEKGDLSVVDVLFLNAATLRKATALSRDQDF